MEHHPFITFNDGLEITYSDLKTRKDGSDYVTLYFRQPDPEGTGFCSAQCTFPGGGFTHVVGYSEEDLNRLREHVARAGLLAYEFQTDPKYF